MARYRNACFTWNNYDEETSSHLNSLPWKYYIIGYEGQNGDKTPHIQGYMEFDGQYSHAQLQKFFKHNHFERRYKSVGNAVEYCKKEGNWEEYGTVSRPGTRSDIATYVEEIRNGMDFLTMAEHYPTLNAKYYRYGDRVRFEAASQNKGFQSMEVIVLYGAAGTGKTRHAYEIDPNLFHVTDHNWWNGFTNQETILLDDYYGEIPYSKFLQLIDGYRFRLATKGGFTWKAYKRVIITSNSPPSEWYQQFNGRLPAALKRRITSCRHFY